MPKLSTQDVYQLKLCILWHCLFSNSYLFVYSSIPVPVYHPFLNESFFAQKLVEDLCEKLQILPINTALFGISYNKLGRRLYFPYTKVLMKEDVLKKKLTLRLQFKVDCTCMHGSDKNAFDYFLLQVSFSLKRDIHLLERFIVFPAIPKWLSTF